MKKNGGVPVAGIGENQQDVEYTGGNAAIMGAQSNFEAPPSFPQKQPGVTSKPAFTLKKGSIRKTDISPSPLSSNFQQNIEDSGKVDDNFNSGSYGGSRQQMPTNI